MGLGRIGVWLGDLGEVPAKQERDAVRELERLGYGAIWAGENPTNREALAHSALLLAWTERITVATGITSIWARDAAAAANGARTLTEAYPGRFLLGLGVSHARSASARGHAYARPLTAMREYLAAMDASEFAVGEPQPPIWRVLAALGPRMLELARERAHGAHPYLGTSEHTRRAREILGDGPTLAPQQAFVLEADPSAARVVARSYLATYLPLPNYRANWIRLGFSEGDLEAGGSDSLVDGLVVWGDEAVVCRRIEEHFAAGADHVCVQALGAGPVEQLRRLAEALTL